MHHDHGLHVCSRLSDNPSPNAPEWRTTLCGRGENDGLPCSPGNGDAGNILGNPDIRVPERTERDNGLGVQREEEEQNADDEERKETEGGRRNGNNVVPLKITSQQREEKSVETRAFYHVPPGTWLTKVLSERKAQIFSIPSIAIMVNIVCEQNNVGTYRREVTANPNSAAAPRVMGKLQSTPGDTGRAFSGSWTEHNFRVTDVPKRTAERPGVVGAKGVERRGMDADWTRTVTRPPELAISEGKDR
ncbi:hypothetical protein NDU88_002381 [Pleurodeles waltl]|uniref:Uncharacterized protein n=1 Tax=Pleurodeles waltl TaxID=8319 RepID=A0AAV7L140_PLEWA|nr:hypothetical protein NDU88_002381 [Pleurodeles waltl]